MLQFNDLIERLRLRTVEYKGYEPDNFRTIPSIFGKGMFTMNVPDSLCQEAARTIEYLETEVLLLKASLQEERYYRDES